MPRPYNGRTVESPFLQAEGLLRYIGLLLSGICHQFAGHSLTVGGAQLPLCARCTGTYLGAMLGLTNYWWRGHAKFSGLPPLRTLVVLAGFFVFWAIDGINSYLNYVTGRVILYAPSNLLRLAAGMVNGLSLSVLIYPLFNFTLWTKPHRQPIIGGYGELAGILVQLFALGWLVQANVPALLYPLATLNLVGVLVMLTLVNTMIVVLLLRRENQAENWRQALPMLSLGLLCSLAGVGGIALVRLWIAPNLPAQLS